MVVVIEISETLSERDEIDLQNHEGSVEE
jgi:hypothetical protein